MPHEFAAYVAHGWKLCAIDPGKKAPTYEGWQTPEAAARIGAAAAGLDGAGLLHALSGTCALDIDDLTTARAWLAERDVDLDALLAAPDAVRVSSGRRNRAKLLYRLSKPLRTLKPQASGIELRSATAKGTSVQDVLPPSIHPDTGKPYAWEYGEPLTGDWRVLPNIPVPLYRVWRELLVDIPPEREAASKAATKSSRAPLLEFYVSQRLARLDPDSYEDWIAAGQAAHAEDSSLNGPFFEAWATWSKRSAKYQSEGPNSPGGKWATFNAQGGRTVLGGTSPPASADEFELVVTPPEPSAAELDERRKAAGSRAAAQRQLEERLVYVSNSERYFDTQDHVLIGSDNAIQHKFTYLMPKRNGSRMNPVKALKESGTKTVVDSLAFHPGEGVIFECIEGRRRVRYANTYRDSLPKPLEPAAAELERINWLFGRIGDEGFRKWLLQFFGHVIQRPGIKIRSAPLLWSETQGNGKTTLLRTIPSLLCGAHYSREVNCSLLSSGFNDYVQNAWHINLAEFRAGTRGERSAVSDLMKQWIAEEAIVVHPKGLPAYTMVNRFFVTATSNHADAAQIDNEDRRWAVHEFDVPQMTPDEQRYIHTEFLSTPRAAGVLRHYFLNVDLTDFSPSAKAPVTESRQRMVEESIGSEVECVRDAFEQRLDVFARDVVISREASDYVKKCIGFRPSEARIGRILAKAPYHGKPVQYRVGDRRYRGIIIRNHAGWSLAAGREIQAHIDGDTDELLV